VRLLPLGVRGSTPAPGLPFVGYGGHTSAVAVLGDGETVPRLVLDAGTGLRDLPEHLDGMPFRGVIVLTHLHWDHVQGLPFCPAVDRPDAVVDLHVPGAWGTGSGEADAAGLLARAMSPPHFPIGPAGLQGRWRFLPARPGDLATATGASVAVRPVAHKGGVTLGVRVELDGVSAAYLPDHALTGERVDAGTLELVAGVDVLLHDGQFTAGERRTAADYGHATVEATLRLADRACVGRLVLTHHAPGRTDEQLDALAARHRATPGGRPVTFARQGEPIDVAGRPAGARVVFARAREGRARASTGGRGITLAQAPEADAVEEP
jgi:phosphoribosyl 1,2-cyclic phosphodiesterase